MEDNKCKNLQELTGQESGIVAWPEGQVIVCNWSHDDGAPRLTPLGGLFWMGELDAVTPKGKTKVGDALGDRYEVIHDDNDVFDADEECMLWQVNNCGQTLLVLAPLGWI